MNNTKKRENLLLGILINVVIPSLILSKLSGTLTEVGALILALSLPLCYGIYEMILAQKLSFFSVIGIVSILLTGGVGLLKLPSEYLAIKEALIPGLLGLCIFISIWTPFPVIRSLLQSGLDFDAVDKKLHEHKKNIEFDSVLTKATLIFSLSFFVSSILNFLLAKWIVVSPTGSSAFNEELGRMTLLSYPVIVVPSFLIMMVMAYYVISKLTKLTGISIEDLMVKR